MSPIPHQNEPPKKNSVNVFLRFSGIAFQMGVLILGGAYGGKALDEQQGNEKPIWTIVFILLAIFASLFQLIREVLKVGKDNE